MKNNPADIATVKGTIKGKSLRAALLKLKRSIDGGSSDTTQAKGGAVQGCCRDNIQFNSPRVVDVP